MVLFLHVLRIGEDLRSFMGRQASQAAVGVAGVCREVRVWVLHKGGGVISARLGHHRCITVVVLVAGLQMPEWTSKVQMHGGVVLQAE